MKRGHDLAGLMKFATSPAWAEPLAEVLADHLEPAIDAFDFDHDELADIVGDHWAGVLWGCAFEDLLTRAVAPDGRNIVDDYIKRRGWNENGPTKRYMRALKSSVMSLYEISEVQPGQGLLARDLIRGGEPVRVSERTASQTLEQGDRIGARIVEIGGKHILSGGLLSFTIEAADELIRDLGPAEGTRNPPVALTLDDEQQRALPALISTTWLFDVVSRTMEPAFLPVLHDNDGEEVVFHRVRFPLAGGATDRTVGERLDAVTAFERETAHVWNWLGEKPHAMPMDTGRTAWDGMMIDGTPVLGKVELKGRTLVLAVTSAARAARGTALIADALAGLVGTPLTTIETVEQAIADRIEGATELAPDLSPDIATPLVHAMLDRQYRATLDEPVDMLGDITPRAAAGTAAGRDRLAAWLQHLEHRSGAGPDPNDPMATYDFTWIWRELGIEDLRR